MNIIEYIITFVIGVIVTLFTEYFITRRVDSKNERKSDYTGYGRQRIFLPNDIECKGECIKEDIYNLKHYETNGRQRNRRIHGMNVNLHGEIFRVRPKSQQREWRFIGYLADEVMTILYEPKSKRKKSRGCIYLKKIRDESTGNDFFRGFYLEEHRDGSIDKTPLTLTKEE